MRTAIAVICYGVALGALLIGAGLIGWGLYEHRSMYVTEQGLSAIGLYMNASFHIAVGAAALGAAALLAIAGREARA